MLRRRYLAWQDKRTHTQREGRSMSNRSRRVDKRSSFHSTGTASIDCRTVDRNNSTSSNALNERFVTRKIRLSAFQQLCVNPRDELRHAGVCALRSTLQGTHVAQRSSEKSSNHLFTSRKTGKASA